MDPTENRSKYHDGRDEMNLADFPISALQRQQPSDDDGRKLDRLEFEASRYDPVTRQRVRAARDAHLDGPRRPADAGRRARDPGAALRRQAQQQLRRRDRPFRAQAAVRHHGLVAERPQLHPAARCAAPAEVADDPLRKRLVGRGRPRLRGGSGDGHHQRLPDRPAGQRAAHGRHARC